MVLAEELRQAVLQAALQGKLTEQIDTDSNVDEMLESIHKEKEELVVQKKIKKEKPLPKIQEKDVPFDIPDNWRWVRLGDVLRVSSGDSLTSKNMIEGSIPVYGGNGINGYHNKYNVDKATLTIGRVGANCGAVHITEGKAWITDNAFRVSFLMKQVNIFYWAIILRTLDLGNKSKATAQPVISGKTIYPVLSPFPPIEEQQRIVDKINEIMPKIDEYEKIEKELEALKKEFPTNMKDALLQAAMQGKLTEQLESDGSVDELLLNIEADRKAQISSGFVKKDKRLFTNYVDDEDMPIVIPANWRGVTIGSIVYKLTDGTHKTPKYAIDGVKFVSVKDISSGKLVLNDTKYITSEEHKELYKRCNPEKGDMLISKVGTTGVPAIIDTDEEFSLFVSVALLKYNHQFINEKFFYYLLMSPLVQEQVKENTRGIGNKNWVLDFIAKTIIVLPPIEEQQRIVERLDALLPLCEDLKEEE